MICKNCGQEQADGIKFCANCGAAMEEPQEPVTVAEPVVEPQAEAASAESAPVLTGKGKGRVAVLAIGAVVAIAVVVLLVKLLGGLFGGSGAKPMVAFVNDRNEMQFRANLKEKTESVEVTDESVDTMQFSPDGKKLYYLERDSSYTGDLYMVKTPVTEKSKPERIARDIRGFDVLDTGKVLFWDDDSYQVYEGKESYELVDREDVESRSLSEDEKSFYYIELDSSDRETLYKLDIKKGAKAQKLLEDAYEIYSDYDADVLIYAGKKNSDDGTVDVYSCKPGGKGTELVSDVKSVWLASGTKADFYYTKGNQSEVTLYDLVDDDMLAEDQATLSGEEPMYPDSDDYYFYSGDYIEDGNVVRYVTRSGEERTVPYDPSVSDAYNVAYDDADRRYNEAYDAYWEASEKWNAAQNREEVREALKAETYGQTTYDLYHYNGKVSDTPMVSGVASLRSAGMEDGILIYKKAEQESVGKVIKMSETSRYDAYYDVWNKASSGSGSSDDTWYVNVGGAESELDVKSGTSISDMYVLDGKEVVLDLYEGSEDVLKVFAVKGKGLEELGELASKNYSVAGYNYRKDADKEKAKTLYFYDGVKSDRDDADLMSYTVGGKAKAQTVVENVESVYLLEDGTMYARTDDKELSVVKKGDAKEILDDLNEYNGGISFMKGGKILYINDKGDLKYYNGKESVRLEKNVNWYVMPDDVELRGSYYSF